MLNPLRYIRRPNHETDSQSDPNYRQSSTHLDCSIDGLVCSSHEPALDLWALVSGMGNLRYREGRELFCTKHSAPSSSRRVLGYCDYMARIRLLVHCLLNMEQLKLNLPY